MNKSGGERETDGVRNESKEIHESRTGWRGGVGWGGMGETDTRELCCK